MIYSDFHMHSCFSSDSDSKMEDMVKGAIDKGLKTICFTDHYDFMYPALGEPKWDFIFSIPDYFNSVQALKERYQKQIEIRCGVELGLRNEPDLRQEVKSFYDKLTTAYPFDFIIGSTHVLESTDPYYDRYWEGKTKEQGLNDYFRAIKENAEFYSCFDVYGHLDYIIRYVRDTEKDYKISDYQDILDEALKKLITSGKGIEINTSGFKYGLGRPHPKPEILKRYKELGGTILSIGSDAHKPEHLACDFKKAKNLLNELGFSYYTIFRDRKPIQMKL
ncbi:MAG: histidinol-phosphatase HisJ family protein [Lachnospiraceae bacterium]|nr:histidinol-phosphatase HisJ family protein [Lachnospiraceae bacterium]